MDTPCDSVELAPLALGNYIWKIFLRPFLHVCGVPPGSLRIQESMVLFQPPLNSHCVLGPLHALVHLTVEMFIQMSVTAVWKTRDRGVRSVDV